MAAEDGTNQFEMEIEIKVEQDYDEVELCDPADFGFVTQDSLQLESSKTSVELDTSTPNTEIPGLAEGTSSDKVQDTILIADAHTLYNTQDKLNETNVESDKAKECTPQETGQPNEDHSFKEIWTTDDEIPTKLREMLLNVVKRRQKMALYNNNRRKRKLKKDDDDSASDNEEFDPNDARSKQLLEGVDSNLEWFPMNTFRGEEENFTPERTGSVVSYSTAYDAFRAYWDDDILQQIANKANHYAEGINTTNFKSEWYPTNTHEILCLFAFWIMLGIIKMPTIHSCFSSNPLLKTEIFRQIFTLRRYSALARILHFVDSGDSPDRLHHLRPIMSHLNTKFQANFIMSKDIYIGEGSILWQRQHNFKRFRRTKTAESAITTFELCDSSTNYLWSFLVDTGKENTYGLVEQNMAAKNIAIVKKLIAPLHNQGYRLFMDGKYISPLLARYLKSNGVDCVGPLLPSAQDAPPIVTHAPLEKGQFIARHSGDVCVLSWQEYVRVNMLSTCHGTAVGLPTVSSQSTNRPLPIKPQMALDYNKSVGTVEQSEQMLEPYLAEGRRSAIYMMLFKRLLNSSILNACILLESSMKCPLDQMNFRLQLVELLLSNHLTLCPLNRRMVAACRSAHPARILQQNHWLVQIPPNASNIARNRKARQGCVVCSGNKKYKRSPYKCETCDVPLCVENCFKIYHTT